MDDKVKAAKEAIRRSVSDEFIRMEDDFDKTRDARGQIFNLLVKDIPHLGLTDEGGSLKADVDDRLKAVGAVLKTLGDIERASATAINLKLRNQEQEMANAAQAKDRIQVILQATAPGRIEHSFPAELLEQHLEEMFDAGIKDTELRANPKDISD